MAKAEAASAGMAKAELKRHLRLATEGPIPVAFALDASGKNAVLQMHRSKNPKALEKQLKDEAPDSKNHRWGTASVDPDDPKLVRFTVNKAGGGMARKLIIALKGTGFNKVKLQLEDGTELEAGSDEEDGDDEAQAATGSSSPDSHAADASDQQPAAEAAAETDRTAPANATAGQPAAAELAKTLTGLVKRMMEVIAADPSKKTGLAELATDASASLRRGDLAQAVAGMDVLRDALGDPGTSTEDAQPTAETAPQDTDTPEPADQGTDTAADTADTDTASSTDTDPADLQTAPADTAPDTGPGPTDSDADTSQSASAQDPGKLVATVAQLVKQLIPIMANDPAQRDSLKGIVAQAQASLKSGDLDTASGHVDTLRGMLDGASQTSGSGNGAAQTQPAPAPPAQPAIPREHAPVVAKARTAWVATRKRVESDMDKLHGAFGSAFKGHEKEGDLTKAFRARVETVLGTLDEGLAHTLDAVNNATDPAERAKLIDHAHATIDKYRKHVASDPTIAELDRNPFVPLSIGKTMSVTLAALSKSIR